MIMFLGKSVLVDDEVVLNKIRFLQVQKPEDHGGYLNGIIEDKLPGFRVALLRACDEVKAKGGVAKYVIYQNKTLVAYSDCTWDGDQLFISSVYKVGI